MMEDDPQRDEITAEVLKLANGALGEGTEITRIILGVSRAMAELTAVMLLQLDNAARAGGEDIDTEQVFDDLKSTYETMTRLAYTRLTGEAADEDDEA
ncbi:MAG: hypothetical protein GVY13_12785 [Alphaproteobacteria bacterium]|jgi:hypothetical protein|nr:hypothetical protein [Alphaproteobacteria bacterium]